MKLLAILKDSFRETVDSKVFSVLLALSVGLFLVFASLSFTPKPNTDLRFLLPESLNRDDGSLPPDKRLLCTIRGVEFVDGPANHPATPVVLTLSARHPTAAAATEARTNLPAIRRLCADRL